jgi:carboxymethylenebutenolidase
MQIDPRIRAQYSTPRYHEAAAKLAWERTVAFFRKHLA